MINISTTKDKTAITLRDAKGNLRVSVGNESTVTKKTGIVEERPVSSIVVVNEEGNVLWAIP